MQAVILAGGLGTRISEETHLRPKPMIEIGGEPILWHLMKLYSHYGINDFIICLGYKGYFIKEYFHNYALHMSDVTIDLRDSSLTVHESTAEPWRITLVDTGAETLTGGRLRRVRSYLQDGPFCFTYGDGLSDVNIAELVAYHRSQRRLATLTAVQPPGRFGAIVLNAGRVTSFREKADASDAWINGGFFVLEPGVIDYIQGDDTAWEAQPLERLAAEDQLSAFQHRGFWHPLDTLRDKTILEALWASGSPPWRPSD
ncbi:MAG TPA: glucose-1-phosphate cytidylyltransferase [Candidatus Acidoferrum sp.]|nr:glucose-1-phosphate cytidylyltransferase [Candidatus Acidoferrum sp.]